jgi:hypothetical protein
MRTLAQMIVGTFLLTGLLFAFGVFVAVFTNPIVFTVSLVVMAYVSIMIVREGRR